MTQAKNTSSPLVDFDEIRKVFRSMPSCAARSLADDLPDYLGSRLKAEAFWLRSVYARAGKAQLATAKMALFYANNIFAAPHATSVAPVDLPARDYTPLIQGLMEGEAMLNHMCLAAQCNLQLYELDPDTAVEHSPEADSMDVQEAAMALTYGMMTVEQQTDCLLACAFGNGTERVALGLLQAILMPALTPQNTVQNMAQNRPNADAKGLDRLRTQGSREIAALCGAMIAARLAGIPVVVEGLTGLAAMAVLSEEAPQAINHCYRIDTPLAAGLKIPAQWPCFSAPARIDSTQDHPAVGADLLLAYADLKMISALLCAGHNKAAA